MKGKKPLSAVVLHLAHGRIISNMPLDVLIAYADALRGSGRRARGYIHDAIGMAGQDSRRHRQIRRLVVRIRQRWAGFRGTAIVFVAICGWGC